MPEIAPNTWSATQTFFWWRKYQDGRVEQEVDPETGQIRPWGSKTPNGLAQAGWMPISQDLARKMVARGMQAVPAHLPPIDVRVNPGDALRIYKETTVYRGLRIECKSCGTQFRVFGDRPTSCLVCGVGVAWRCPKCAKLSDTEFCPDCGQSGKFLSPFRIGSESWDEVEYCIGIKDQFLCRITPRGIIIEH